MKYLYGLIEKKYWNLKSMKFIKAELIDSIIEAV